MALTEAQRNAVKKYHAKFDELKLRVPLGTGDLIRAHAASQNETVNAFLNRAVQETMARDKSE